MAWIWAGPEAPVRRIGAAPTGLSVVSWARECLDVFGLFGNGCNTGSDARAWSEPEDLGHAGSAPCAVSRAAMVVDVFAKWAQGERHHAWLKGTQSSARTGQISAYGSAVRQPALDRPGT